MKAKLSSKLNKTSKQQFRNEIKHELKLLLDWWTTHMLDHENGGFYGRIDGFGKLHPQADKGVILNTRLLWTFSAAAIHTSSTLYESMAHRAYDYLINHFWDGEAGGVYWMADYQGLANQTQKQIYAQAFAIYALSEYYILTRDKAALEKAQEIFHLIEKHSRDYQKQGYRNVFSKNWEPLADQRLSEKDEDRAKIMNTHLHIMEAYANLHKASPSSQTAEALAYNIHLIIDKFCNRQPRHLYLFFDDDWHPSSEERSFGHDIECSWLLVEAAEILAQEDVIVKAQLIAQELAHSTLHRGVDSDNGIIEKTDHSGLVPETEKHWWPQAEAIVGFLAAYQYSNELRFWQAALNSWTYIKAYFKDNKQGEWHWMIDQNQKAILDKEDKAGAWKASYHSVRMCLEVLHRTS